MVGIQYQFGKEQSIKLLKSVIKSIEDDRLTLMDIELQTKGMLTVEFECYECGYKSSKTFFRHEDISATCDQCYNKSGNVKYMNPYLVKRKNRGS